MTIKFIKGIIKLSLRYRYAVVVLSALLFTAFALTLNHTKLDAIPDLSDTQVIIKADWAGQSPEVIEDQVTYPVSVQMLGLPKTKVVRGYSMFGSSFVYVLFQEDVDMYWARTRVLEALSQIDSALPTQAEVELGPDATGVGWVFQYGLYDKSGKHDLAKLRSLQDWFIKYELTAVDGVAEVASVGGFVKEYQVFVSPEKLKAYNLAISDISSALQNSVGELGGRSIELGGAEYLIKTLGYAEDVGDIAKTVVATIDDSPITIADVGRVVTGPALRRGVTDFNGQGEMVSGIVIARPSANALDVISDVKERLAQIQSGLPEGVVIQTIYDRSTLIIGAVDYLKDKLFEESLAVAFIIFLFLWHVRSTLVAIITIPMGVLAALSFMTWQGVSANIMSLGGLAIAIGAMVDASIVMVENAHKYLAKLPTNIPFKQRYKAVETACLEVGPGVFFSLLIMTVSFIPVFVLGGQSAKLFTPLALTKTYAMAMAALLSIVLVPVLIALLVKGKIHSEENSRLSTVLQKVYQPILRFTLMWPKLIIAAAVIITLSTVWPLVKSGSEFMPPLNEQSILYMPMTIPSVSIAQAKDIAQLTNKQIMEVPEVATTFAKAGRSDSATDPAPLAMLETWIALKPQTQWREGMTFDKIMAELKEKVGMPGLVNSWGYPIKIRLDMLSTGIRTPVGVKVMGDDLETINTIAKQVEATAQTMPEVESAIADRVVGGRYITISPQREQLAKYGLTVGDMQKVISHVLGGQRVAQNIEGRERYDITLRYARADRASIEDVENIYIKTPSFGYVLLSDVASVSINNGPSMIKSENGRLTGWVFLEVSSDLGTFVGQLEDKLEHISLPVGYSLKIDGQFEELLKTRDRLLVTIPLTLALIIGLLYMYFSNWRYVAMIVLTVPFALSGGLWWMYAAGYHFSVATTVGFIALAGVAIETALIMLVYLDNEKNRQPIQSVKDMKDAIHRGALLRLRPKVMTVSTIIIGLIPIFLTTGVGSDVMRHIALPMLSGMLSTLILTLVVIPALFYKYLERRYR